MHTERERETDRERQTDRQRVRQTETMLINGAMNNAFRIFKQALSNTWTIRSG